MHGRVCRSRSAATVITGTVIGLTFLFGFATLSPLRQRYDALMASDSELDALLATGAGKARKPAVPVLDQVRKAIGIGWPPVPSPRKPRVSSPL